MKAIRVNEHGGPEALSYEDVDVAEPGPGQARVRLAASGVNFIDVYMRTGIYPGETPFTLGLEGAGEVEAVGEGVDEVSVGDHVAWAGVPSSYAEQVVAPADKLVPFNVTMVEARVAAAIMLQGMTAHYLTHSTFPLQEGQTALVHAAAGGVGLLLCQMAKMRGRGSLAPPAPRRRPRSRGRRGPMRWSCTGRKTSPKRRTASPAARVSTWSTTPSARTPSTGLWIA
ncbi:alcohol dehydrogenase catalytic domain-containing protein [Rubrobacter tropicus]|uniref:Alcohol dehydrogenase catalytic domain-containing protein n=1 Tax=Rubrobacter tropicus TaxID=2653851 RepID=A0A6G8Q7K7_9ACTN|nr:alcohol dehydrogenase catalytic domain-containing protein [Rubrobacter tropicus]